MMELYVQNLLFPAIIGVHEWEKERQRQFRMHILIHYDASKAIAGDDINHALDYAKIEQLAIAYALSRPWNLIETLAHRMAERLLAGFVQIEAIRVTVEKPQALDFAESVAATAFLQRTGTPGHR